MSELTVIILAAGQGKRMRSRQPKVLHRVGGRAMLARVVDTAWQLGAVRTVVVYGHGGEQVREQLSSLDVVWVEQAEQLGTGHAVDQAVDHIGDADSVLILYGDVPLIRRQTLEDLLSRAGERRLALLTVELADPAGYGRIVRDGQGRVTRIVEHKDAAADELEIPEINTGILAVRGGRLKGWLDQLENDNSQGEYYLTDIIAMAVAEGIEVVTTRPAYENDEVMGVNDRMQLAHLEGTLRQWETERLMRAGATLLDPARVDVRGQVEVGEDVTIDINVILEGRVVLGRGVRVGANTVIRDAEIGDGVIIQPHCVIEDAIIGGNSRIGPFARIRPETRLAEEVHVGNFVEIKKSEVRRGSKINHLSYVGDSEIGSGVNIGAGTITCNYDGAYKHKTVIGDNAFIGSDTQLVAPVTVGEGATIGAGSTITRDTPAGELTLSRTRQQTRPGWVRPKKRT